MLRCLFVGFFAQLLLLPSLSRADDSDEIYANSVPGLVWIRNHFKDGVSTGSGFMVDKDRGLVVTNHHVAQRERTMDVFFPAPNGRGRWMTDASYYTENMNTLRDAKYYSAGYLAAYDPELDLAVVHVKQMPPGTQELAIASEDPDSSDKLHILGNPAARDLWRYCAAIEPRLSNVRLSASGTQDAYDYKAISMTSSAFSGNSGGPVLNNAGQVIGVLARAGGDGGKRAIAVHYDELNKLLSTIEFYRVFSIENTSGVTLYYQINWDDGEWKEYSLGATSNRTHWYSGGGKHVPNIRFDCSSAQGYQEQVYQLKFHTASLGKNVKPNKEDHAREYYFQYNRAGNLLDLYSR